MRRPIRLLPGAAAAIAALCFVVGAARAEGPEPKENGDGPDDLAPLARGGNFATKGAAGHEQTPGVGAASQGGGVQFKGESAYKSAPAGK